MSETWVNIYLWVLIVWSLVDIFLLLFRPIFRMLGKAQSNDDSRKPIKQRLLIRECFQLIIGVIGLALFKQGILGEWAVLGFCAVLLVGTLFIKPIMRSVK